MGAYTVIPQDTFDGLQMDAGVLLKKFDPANPGEVADEDIITATTGGINAVATPTFSDLGEDVDNCPVNMKELKHLDSWECTLGFTALGTDKESIRMELGCADINADSGAIVPRRDLAQTDFSDVWWVGDRADGGCVAIQLKNALSTGGFSLQTTKSGKGQISCTLTGHVSIKEQKVVPMVIYSIDPAKSDSGNTSGDSGNTSSDTKTETKYTVTFYNGDTSLGTEEVVSGGTATASSITTTKEGYDFKGWTTTKGGESAEDSALTNVTANRDVYAVYTTTTGA